MIEVREIDLETANSYLKQEGLNESEANLKFNRLNSELYNSVKLKGATTSIKGPIFEKFMPIYGGKTTWLGAFDGNKFAGIHWHSITHTGSDEISGSKDVFDGNLFADNVENARALHEEFDRRIKDKYIVNYAFSFPDEVFDLDYRKSLGYKVWATSEIKNINTNKKEPLYFLKRLSGLAPKVTTEDELKKIKIALLKKQLEELGA
jgi:hypothetical protein|tara:strand:- start:4295 stop:4912 length:618 start_codon:yes stop_codon:yes gene_type:complete